VVSAPSEAKRAVHSELSTCEAQSMADHDLDGGFFVFGDLSVKIEGEFRLKFTLFEMRK
jgi:hypothetical protein